MDKFNQEELIEKLEDSKVTLNVGRIMTRIVWGDKVANSGWIDPEYKSK